MAVTLPPNTLATRLMQRVAQSIANELKHLAPLGVQQTPPQSTFPAQPPSSYYTN